MSPSTDHHPFACNIEHNEHCDDSHGCDGMNGFCHHGLVCTIRPGGPVYILTTVPEDDHALS